MNTTNERTRCWCGRLVRIRKDGTLAKHHMDVGMGGNRGTLPCHHSGRTVAALRPSEPGESPEEDRCESHPDRPAKGVSSDDVPLCAECGESPEEVGG